MKAKKSLFAASAIAVLGLGVITTLHTSPTYAASNTTNLVDRLVERFSLNRDDVQAVFDEHRSGLMADHEQTMKDRLAQAVTDGKITQAQADLITARHAELKTFMESLKDKTMAERQEAMKTKMDELKKWAEDNDIPLQYLHVGMKGPRGKFGGHMGMGFHRFSK